METTTRKIPLVPFYNLPFHFIGLLKNPIKEICRMTKKYGDIFAVGNINAFSKQPNKPAVFVNHPDYVKQILKDNQPNYSRGQVFKDRKDLSILEDFLGNGIFMSDGKDWEEQHRMIKTIFSAEAITQTHTIIQKETAQLVTDWEKQLEKTNTIDVETSVHLMMLKILFKAQIIKADDYDFQKLFDVFQNIMQYSSFRKSVLHFVKSNIIYALGMKYEPNRHQKYIIQLEQLVDTLFNSVLNGEQEAGSLTAILIQKYNASEITYKEVRDTIMNFIFAGFETTAAGITWTIYCMAKHANEQEKLFQELQSSTTNVNDNFSDTALPYLRLTIKESMRLYPPVWFYMRECLGEDMLNNYVVRKNSLVMICPVALHQHSSFWEHPQNFEPERFDKQNIQGKAFVYIPFGQGKRMCIGQAFAGVQMHIILARIFNEFRFETIHKEEPVINPAIIIKGAKPIHLKIFKR